MNQRLADNCLLILCLSSLAPETAFPWQDESAGGGKQRSFTSDIWDGRRMETWSQPQPYGGRAQVPGVDSLYAPPQSSNGSYLGYPYQGNREYPSGMGKEPAKPYSSYPQTDTWAGYAGPLYRPIDPDEDGRSRNLWGGQGNKSESPGWLPSNRSYYQSNLNSWGSLGSEAQQKYRSSQFGQGGGYSIWDEVGASYQRDRMPAPPQYYFRPLSDREKQQIAEENPYFRSFETGVHGGRSPARDGASPSAEPGYFGQHRQYEIPYQGQALYGGRDPYSQ